jgi:DNA ligase (NAD+)
MDISGLGPSFIENVIKVHEVDSIKSLYGLSYRDLMRLDNMQDKSVKKILASIESVKGSRTLARFIYSLSIHHVGKRASKTIAEGLGKNYLEPTEESLIKLGLSSNVIKSYLEYMKVHKNEVDELEKILRPVMTIEDTNNKLKVCITGKLSIPKTEFAKLFPNINFVNNLDKTTDVLIYETKNSTKYNRASRYNITRLTEKEFKENYNE